MGVVGCSETLKNSHQITGRHSPDGSKLSFTVPLHALSMELRPCEATFPRLVKEMLYLAFDGTRSYITVFATASYLSDGSTYVYVFQALCFPSSTGTTLPEFLPSPTHITCPTYLIFLDFITLIISHTEMLVRNSSQLLFCM